MKQRTLLSLLLSGSCAVVACSASDTSSEGASVAASDVTGGTDSAQYNFESSAQGWAASGSPVSAVASSAARAYGGTHSLAVTLNGAKGQASAFVASPSVAAGTKVTFEVWCPSGSPVTAVQPYALQGASGNWGWTGNWQSTASLQANAWNALSITLPTNAKTPLAQLGVQFTTNAGASATCYVDSVSWGGGTSGGTVDAGAPVDSGTTTPVDSGTTTPVDSGTTTPVDSGATGGSSAAAALAKRLRGKSNFMMGLGNDEGAAAGLGLPLDLNYNYLLSNWPTWNTDADGQGAIVTIDAQKAAAMGATPAFVLYDMEDWGEAAEPSLANDAGFMTTYWSRLRILFQRLGKLGTSSLVLLEPDFWGFTYFRSPKDGSGPAQVTQAAECAGLPNTIAGLSHCYINMRNAYSPKTAIGLDISMWGTSAADVIPFYKALGANAMDFIGLETLDRDAGCYEGTGDPECTKSVPGAYWDENNVAHPNFHDHLATVQQLTSGIGVPGIWWQTPLGAPSSSPGGTRGHYRDNRVHYFFSHVNELIAAGGAGVMFGSGTSPANHQTTVTTDNGQFKNAASGYFAKPSALP